MSDTRIRQAKASNDLAPVKFLVIGTGRCGSLSVSKILDACSDVICTHERKRYRVAWKDKKRKGPTLFLAEAHGIYGDAAAYWLPHIEWMRQRCLKLKVIVLQRDCADFTASLKHWWQGENRFCKHRDHPWRRKYIPYIEGDFESCARAYWSMYYKAAAKLDNKLWIRTKEIDYCIDEMFDYLGVAKRCYASQKRWNKTIHD